MRLTLRRRGAATRWPDDRRIAKQIAAELAVIAEHQQVDVEDRRRT
jgi:hypothetical protein